MRDDLAVRQCEWSSLLVPSKLQPVPFLHSHHPVGELRGSYVSIVPEEFAIVEVVKVSVIAERKAVESDHDGDKLV